MIDDILPSIIQTSRASSSARPHNRAKQIPSLDMDSIFSYSCSLRDDTDKLIATMRSSFVADIEPYGDDQICFDFATDHILIRLWISADETKVTFENTAWGVVATMIAAPPILPHLSTDDQSLLVGDTSLMRDPDIWIGLFEHFVAIGKSMPLRSDAADEDDGDDDNLALDPWKHPAFLHDHHKSHGRDDRIVYFD